jgi:competence protein ComEC
VTIAWRLAALAGCAGGLAFAPLARAIPLPALEALVLLAIAALALAAIRPRAPAAARSWPWIGAVGVVAAAAGLVAGAERVAAIDRDAFAGEPGSSVEVRGFVTAVPRPVNGMVTIPVATRDGRLAIEVPQPDRELLVGEEIRASGAVREPEPWRAGRLRILGIRRLVRAQWVEPTGRSRGGIAGAIDKARERAESALDRGVPDREAALARGFVLGQDDRIDAATVDDFRRSGLAHLLAVSGQNVLLLALLAYPVLALLGVPLRARLAVVLVLIAIYVPLAGAGPSIQRAAVMGAAGIAALLACRPAHRWYALALAAMVTLAVNPRAAADVGWQLSFAAVVGILLWARPLAATASRALRRGPTAEGRSRGLRDGLANGIGVTLAATIATAPVSAQHFETISVASLAANLLALPAVAPVMWLGMLSAALGQLGWFPVEPLNWAGSLLLAYIAQVAHWLGEPGWATAEVAAPGPVALTAILAILVAGGFVAARGARRRRRLGGAVRLAIPLTVAAAAIPLAAAAGGPASPPESSAASHLTLSMLDVGQGDSILLDPEPGGAILVDTGPPGTDVAGELEARGVGSLSAVLVTHEQSDHAGGLSQLFDSVPVETVAFADAGRKLRLAARSAGARTAPVARGQTLRDGALRLEVLWPPAREGRPRRRRRGPERALPGPPRPLAPLRGPPHRRRRGRARPGRSRRGGRPQDRPPRQRGRRPSDATRARPPAPRPHLGRLRQPLRPSSSLDPVRACRGRDPDPPHRPARGYRRRGTRGRHGRGRLGDGVYPLCPQ